MLAESDLQRVPLLRDAGEAARRVLAERGSLRRYPPDAVLWRRGDAPRGLFVVLSGEVRVVRSSAGRQRVVHTEGPGGTLGEIPLFEGASYPATAVAARRTTCATFDRDAILAAIRADPDFAFALLARLAARVRLLIERLERVGARSVPARLAEYLLQRAESCPGDVVTLGRTQQEVAEELGTAREVVVRGLRTLRRAGFIEAAGRGRIRIRDAAALRATAESTRHG